MLKLELYRIFGRKRTFLFLLTGLLLETVFSLRIKTVMFDGFDDDVYRYYISRLEGAYTKEKQEWIEAEYERMTERIANADEYERQYFAGEMDAEEYRRLSDEVKSAGNREKTVGYLLEKTQYYSGCKGNPEYFYDIAISDYIENMSMDFVLIFVLILLILPVFHEDYEAGTVLMVRSCAYGREKLYLYRMGAAGLVSLLTGFLFYLTEFFTKAARFDLGNLNADVKSLLNMSQSGLDLTIGEYLLLTVLIRTIYTGMAGIVIMLIANMLHSSIGAFAVSAACLFLPYFLCRYLPVWLQDLSLCSGLGAYRLFSAAHKTAGFPPAAACAAVHAIVFVPLILYQRRKF